MPINVARFQTDKELTDFANGVAARGLIVVPDPRHLTDEHAIIIDDGTNPATEFRIDLGGDGVGAGTAIDVSAVADGDKAALATAIETAINGVAGGLTVTATATGDKILLVNDNVGAAGNVAVTQSSNALNFEIEGMAGGADAITSTDIVSVSREDGQWMMVWTT